jgi:hypothetical protein
MAGSGKRVASEQEAGVPSKKAKVAENNNHGDVFPFLPRAPGQTSEANKTSLLKDKLTIADPVAPGATMSVSDVAEQLEAEILRDLEAGVLHPALQVTDLDDGEAEALGDALDAPSSRELSGEDHEKLREAAIKLGLPAAVLDKATTWQKLLEYSNVDDDNKHAIENFVEE